MKGTVCLQLILYDHAECHLTNPWTVPLVLRNAVLQYKLAKELARAVPQMKGWVSRNSLILFGKAKGMHEA